MERRKGERFRLTRILSRESYREMFSQKMFRRKNITLDFFCRDEEDSLFFFFLLFSKVVDFSFRIQKILKEIV